MTTLKIGQPAPGSVTTGQDKGKANNKSRTKKFNARVNRYVPVAVSILIIAIGLWIGSKIFSPILFPGPGRTLVAAYEILTTQYMDLLITSLRYVVALGLAIVAGWAVGLLMGAFRKTVGRFVEPLILIVQAIPALSYILLSVLWMTNVELRITWVTFMIAFPFFVIAVYEGIRDMDKDMLEAIQQFRPTRFQVLTMLLIPQSVVHVITATRTTAAMALKILIFAELVGSNNGIGQAFSMAQNNFRIDHIFAWSVLLVIINFLLISGLVAWIEKKVLSWRAEAEVR